MGVADDFSAFDAFWVVEMAGSGAACVMLGKRAVWPRYAGMLRCDKFATFHYGGQWARPLTFGLQQEKALCFQLYGGIF
jgi:hypothetical protein